MTHKNVRIKNTREELCPMPLTPLLDIIKDESETIVRSHPYKRAILSLLPPRFTRKGIVLEQHIREGRFQRSLSLITAFSSLLAGLEVTYEHYRGSYGQRIM